MVDYKTILGDQWTQEKENELKSAVAKDFVSKPDFHALSEAKKQLEADIAKRDAEIATLTSKAGEVDALNASIAQMKAENEAALETMRQGIALEKAVDKALAAAQARNPAAVLGLINRDVIKLEGDKLIGLDEQLAAIKVSDPYLFGAPGTPGFNPPEPPETQPKTLHERLRAKAETIMTQ